MKKIYTLSLLILCLSSCEFITGQFAVNETLLTKSGKVFSSEKDMELTISEFANEVFPNKHNLYCYTTEKNIDRYVLLQQTEKSGLLKTYKTGEVVVYRDNTGEIKAISILGNFSIPTFFKNAASIGNIRDKVVKKVTHKGKTYAVIAYPNELEDNATSCSDPYSLSESVILKTKIVIYKNVDLPDILYQQFIKGIRYTALSYFF